MTTITINNKNHTIEMSKAFNKQASIYGTPEYNDLQNVRRDYPNYRIAVKAPSKKNDPFKGLTIAYMESYIQKHDKSRMAEFDILRGKTNPDEENSEYAESASFFEIKKWFLAAFPEIKEYHANSRKKIDEIMSKIA